MNDTLRKIFAVLTGALAASAIITLSRTLAEPGAVQGKIWVVFLTIMLASGLPILLIGGLLQVGGNAIVARIAPSRDGRVRHMGVVLAAAGYALLFGSLPQSAVVWALCAAFAAWGGSHLAYKSTERIVPPLAGVVGLAIALAGICIFLGLERTRSHADLRIPLTSPETRSTDGLLVVGIDGADWDLVSRLVESGRLPNFKRAIDEGASGPLHTLQPTSSPFLWNTIYSGYTPAIHRLRPPILEVGAESYFGAPLRFRGSNPVYWWLKQVSTASLRYPLAFWDVLSAAGYSTAAIGVWDFLPSPQSNAIHATTEFEYDPARPDQGLDFVGSPTVWVSPPLREIATRLDVPPTRIPAEEWEILIKDRTTVARMLSVEGPGTGPAEDRRLARLRAIYASDRLRLGLAKLAFEKLATPRQIFVYFRGIDIMQHCYAHLLRGDSSPAESGLEGIIERYYELVDGWVRELAELAGPETTVVLLSDHGLNLDEHKVSSYKTGFHDYAPNGIFVATGPGIRSGSISSAHILDVAPTLLALAGSPLLASMEGRVLPEVATRTQLVEDWTSLTSTVYETGNPELSNPELEERLRALGYVE